jgi:hypothetical protein
MTGHGRARRYAGYAEVEIGGTYDGRTAAAFRALANQYGLKPEGSHVPGGGATWRGNRGQVFADAAALGLRYVGIAAPPDGTPRTHDGYRAGGGVQHLGRRGPRTRTQVLLPQPPGRLHARRRHADLRHAARGDGQAPGLVRARHRLDRGGRPERLRLRSREPLPLPAVPQGHQVGRCRSAHHAGQRSRSRTGASGSSTWARGTHTAWTSRKHLADLEVRRRR